MILIFGDLEFIIGNIFEYYNVCVVEFWEGMCDYDVK